MSASRRRPRSSEIKWHFVQNESEKVLIFKKNKELQSKDDDKEIGNVINITASKTDTKDEKLKVFQI